jgi:hypothetical protein
VLLLGVTFNFQVWKEKKRERETNTKWVIQQNKHITVVEKMWFIYKYIVQIKNLQNTFSPQLRLVVNIALVTSPY